MSADIGRKVKNQVPTGERGTVLVIVAFTLMTLLGFAGLAIDFGYYFVQKTRMQALADATALACAQGKCDRNAAANLLADGMLVPIISPFDTTGVSLTLEVLPTCKHSPDDECLQVTATKAWDTFFIKLFNVSELKTVNLATAIGGNSTPVTSSTPATMAIDPGGSGVYLVRNGGIDINGNVISNSSQGVNTNTYTGINAANVNGDVFSIGPVSPNITVISPGTVEELDQPIDDPCKPIPSTPPSFCNHWPDVCLSAKDFSCTKDNDTVHIPSGNYGSLNIEIKNKYDNCTLTMSGQYTALNNFSISIKGESGRLEATNTSIFTNEANVRIDLRGKNSVVSMQPRSSGDYAGLLFWRIGNRAETYIDINESSASVSLGGVHYAPNANLLMQRDGGRGGIVSVSGLIAKSIEIKNFDSHSPLMINHPENSVVCAVNDDGSSGGGGGGSTNRLKLVN